jgi:hypothetical protein
MGKRWMLVVPESWSCHVSWLMCDEWGRTKIGMSRSRPDRRYHHYPLLHQLRPPEDARWTYGSKRVQNIDHSHHPIH